MGKSTSCGLLLFEREPELRVLLAHPGGPYFAKKDLGSWSIPKGLVDDDDADHLETAKREFIEETGYDLSQVDEFLPLGEAKLKSGKLVHAWAFVGSWADGREPKSNHFELEWPPRSGRTQSFPEIDRAKMFAIELARHKINERQLPFLDRLIDILG